MSKPKSIHPNQEFHRLTVVGFHHQDPKTKYRIWECLCECGNTTFVSSGALNSGSTKSCGCFQRDTARLTRLSHGMSRKKCPEYNAWVSMRQRCHSDSLPCAPDYIGRGICVCPEWESFEVFYSDVGPRPSPLHTVERIDNNGNYEPGNVKWATRTEQQRNRRINVLITFQGVTLCKAAWAEKLNLSFNGLNWRLKHWPIDRALTAKET